MRRSSLVVLCGWVVFLTALAFWLGTTENPVLRDQLRRSQFWMLEALFAVLVGLTALNAPALIRSLSLTRNDYLVVTGAAALAAVLAANVAPRTNRIYYDEQIYQGIAQNMTDLRLAQMCNDGTLEYGVLQCWRGEYNKQPYGFPYLLSLVYRVSGVHYWTAPAVNVLCAALFAMLAFVLSLQLFDDRMAARMSSMVAALIPQQLLWSHTAAAEPSAALTCLLAVVAAMHFVRTRTTPALLWTAVATAFALQFRIESALVGFVVALAILLWTPAELRAGRVWGAALLGVMLSAGLLGHLIAVRQEGWGTSGDRFSLEFLASNFQANGAFYISDWRFPAIYTVLAVCGGVLCRRRREVALMAAYFAMFFAIYLFFYAGSYNYGADIRYSVMTFPPLAVLAGIGSAELIRRIEQRAPLTRVRVEPVFALLLAFQFLWYLPLVRAIGEEAWAARADIDFSQTVIDTLPRNSIVLTHNPSVFHVMGRNAAQLSLAANEPQYVKDVLMQRYAGGVYLHWNFWCNVADKVQREFCASARQQFSATVFSEHRERDYRYAFYRLEVDPATNSAQKELGSGPALAIPPIPPR